MARYDFVGGGVFFPIRLMLKKDIADLSYDKDAGQRRYSYYFMKDRREGLTFWKQPEETYPQVLYTMGNDILFDADARHILTESGLYAFPYEQVAQGYFGEMPADTDFTRCGLAQPCASFAMCALMPIVFLVDNRHLQGRPAPTSWKALLSEDYRGLIASQELRGEKPGTVFTSLTFLYGDDAARAFLRNHGYVSDLLRTVSEIERGQAAVYIMPWMFARIANRESYTQIIWPEEGAFINPIWLAARKGKDERADYLLSYFLSDRYAAIALRAGMPTWKSSRKDYAGDDVMQPESPAYYWPGAEALSNLDYEQHLSKYQEALS